MNLHSTFYNKSLPYFFALIFLLTKGVYAIQAQEFTPESTYPSIDSKVNQSNDTISKPDLIIKSYLISELGYLVHSLDSLHKKTFYNHPFEHLTFSQDLGNSYSSTYTLDQLYEIQRGDQIGIQSYNIYHKINQKNQIYVPNRSWASAGYGTQFGASFTNIELKFYREFARDIALNLDILSLKSAGSFAHQATSINHLQLDILKGTPSSRWNMYIHFNLLRNNEEINGGLRDTQDLSTNILGGHMARSTNLSGNNALKNTRFKMGASMKVGQKKKTKLFSEISYHRESFNFEETTSDSTTLATYYSPTARPSSSFSSEIKNIKYASKTGIEYSFKNWNVASSLQMIINHSKYDSTYSTTQNQLFWNLNGEIPATDKIKIGLNAHSELRNSGESLFNPSLIYTSKHLKFTLNFLLSRQRPFLIHQRYKVNETAFVENSFNNLNIREWGLTHSNPKLNYSISFQSTYMSNPIIFDFNNGFEQMETPLNIFQFKIGYKFNFWKLQIINNIHFQPSSENLIFVQPLWSTRHDIALNLRLFKKRLHTKIGSIVWFQNRTNILKYHSYISQFYIPDNFQTNYFFRISPYIKLKIDSLDIFISIDNLINMLNKTYFIGVQDYPQRQSKINLSFKWYLLD